MPENNLWYLKSIVHLIWIKLFKTFIIFGRIRYISSYRTDTKTFVLKVALNKITLKHGFSHKLSYPDSVKNILFNNCIPLPCNHVIWYKPRNFFVSRLRDLYPTINVSKWLDIVIILPTLLLSLLLWSSILTSCFKLYYWFYFFHPRKIKK